GQAIRAGAAQDAKNVVLGSGEAVRLDEQFGVLREAIGRPNQGDEELSFEAGGRRFGKLCGLHAGNIVVTTTIVKRKRRGLRFEGIRDQTLERAAAMGSRRAGG